MSFLIEANLISLCHKKHLPAKFKAWLRKNEADSFISSVTIAEMRYGAEPADASHQPLLSQCVARIEVDFAEAIEPVDTDCLLEWKGGHVPEIHPPDIAVRGHPVGRAMPCQRSYAGHGECQTL